MGWAVDPEGNKRFPAGQVTIDKMESKKEILIVAGETSGDLHGANLARELWKLDSSLILYGVGGEKMARAGVKLYFDIVGLAGVGLTEVFKNLTRLHKIFKELLSIIEKSKLKAMILIDFPEFNLRLAKAVRKFNIPIVYYISPQVWAWRRGRVKTISRYIKKMLVIFPFEEEFYRKLDIPVEFVGHPLLDVVNFRRNQEMVKEMLRVPREKVVVGLLPGSRESEIKRHLPIMLEAAEIIAETMPQVEFVLLCNSSLPEKLFTNIMNTKDKPAVRLLPGRTSEIMDAAELILVASGTATLEAACHSCPMVIIYKISFLTWLFVRPLIRVPYVGIVNLIAKEKIVPEYLQFQARPKAIAQECLTLLKDEKKRSEMIHNLSLVRQQLGKPGASALSARAVLNTINSADGL